MALALQQDVSIAAEPFGPVLRRRGVPVDHPLSVIEALALLFLDASGDAPAAADALSACLPETNGPSWVERAVDRYWCFLAEGPPRRTSEPDLEWLRALAGEGTTITRPPVRSAAPRAVTWLVTLGCHRRCPYCFYHVTPHAVDAPLPPADATFSADRAVAMVREMGRVGAADLYLTGGEPLLRPDLPDIIAEATNARVRTRVVTKYPVSEDLGHRLGRAGLTYATVSLDDARPHTAGLLAGGREHLREATAAIARLREAGVRVDVNAVVTALNEDHLPALVDLLIDLGVERLTLGQLSPPAAPPSNLIRLTRRHVSEAHADERSADALTKGALEPRGPDVATHIARLRERYEGRIEIDTSSSGISDGSRGRLCGTDLVCDVGVTALDVLPDGRVTRCRYLPGRTELFAGSLESQSLLDVWNGQDLARLCDPSPGAYSGTSCSGCEGFGSCNSRGRCFFTALQVSGKLHAPDAFCQR